MKWLKILSCAATFLSFIIVFVLVSTEWPLGISCPMIVIFIISGIYLMCYYLLRKKKKVEKVRFSDFLVNEYEKVMPEEMEKKFQKENRKRKKHGKNEITFDEFVEEEEKGYKLWDRIENLSAIFIPLLCLIFGFVKMYLDDGFESISDMVWFAVIILALESAIVLGMRRLTRANVTAWENWLLEYRENKNKEEKE